MRDKPPQYTGETIDRFGEELDAKMERQARGSASADESSSSIEVVSDQVRQRVAERLSKVSVRGFDFPEFVAFLSWRQRSWVVSGRIIAAGTPVELPSPKTRAAGATCV